MKWLIDNWYRQHLTGINMLAAPLSGLYRLVVALRRLGYRMHVLPSYDIKVPVVVIGNITVGGTGKTPLVIKVAQLLSAAGYNPAIVSRGYGGRNQGPMQVKSFHRALDVGDEPLLMANKGLLVFIGRKRVEAAKLAVSMGQADIIIADDGLQHLALKRHMEIALVNGLKGLGNGWCLPSGPLREPSKRLRDVDYVLSTDIIPNDCEHSVQLVHGRWVFMGRSIAQQPPRQCSKTIHAVAGLANPEGFYQSLEAQGYQLYRHTFPDHHSYRLADVIFNDDYDVVMTEKDAIKCRQMALDRHWCVQLEVSLHKKLETLIINQIHEIYASFNMDLSSR
jgi:tetraacyldisaccharide 4'-kinase